MGILTREQYLSPKLKTIDVVLPEDGGTARLRELTVAQLDAAREKKRESGTTDLQHAAELLALSVVDESGNPVLKPEEFTALMQHGSAFVQTLLQAMNRLNNLEVPATEAVKP